MVVLYAILGIPACALICWLLELPGNMLGGRTSSPSKPAATPPVYQCHGHVHYSQAAVDKCPALKTWLADYSAGLVDYGGNPIPQPGELRACPKCHRNHFADECPPAGYRATDARTGEVVGYWQPRDREVKGI